MTHSGGMTEQAALGKWRGGKVPSHLRHEYVMCARMFEEITHIAMPEPNFHWSSRLRRLRGYFFVSHGWHCLVLKSSLKLDEAQARKTFRHELAHYAHGLEVGLENWAKQHGHGPTFQKWLHIFEDEKIRKRIEESLKSVSESLVGKCSIQDHMKKAAEE